MNLLREISACIIFSSFLFLLLPAIAQIPKKKIEAAAINAFEWYKVIHQEPELGKKEFKTSALIRAKLMEFGYTEFVNVPGLPTAVIALLDSKIPGKTIALRAEMDARPNQENSGLSYSSKVPGIMHSCGHDAHTAILLASAKLFIDNRKSFKGRIVYIFQPAEEIKGGADDIVKAGIIDSLGIQNIYALHVANGVAVGTISISRGPTMAGSNYFSVKLTGKGSHAAYPQDGSNIPVAVSELVIALSQLPGRLFSTKDRLCVISTTFIETGKPDALNLIPSSAIFKGTIRAYEDIDAPYGNEPSIKSIVDNTLKTYCGQRGIIDSLVINRGSPVTINDIKLFDNVAPFLQEKFSGTLDTTYFRSMAAEDFAYFTEKTPCLYFGLGIAKDQLGSGNIHSPEFTIHPEAFKWGIELMTLLAAY